MHIVVIFINVGSYHAARLRAAYSACQEKGWQFTAIQVTDDTLEHPWGDLEREITFPLKTLLPKNDESSYAEQAAAVLPGFLDNLQPSAVVIPGWGFPVSRAALSWCKHHQVPAILMSETKWDDEKRLWWKEKIKFWLLIGKFDAALVGGKLHRDYLMELGFPRDRIFLGYDAVDNDYFAKQAEIARFDPVETRRRNPQIPTKPYFIAVTRLLKRKNVFGLVQAFAAYHQQMGNEQAWDLVICGSGEEEAEIRNFIMEQKLQDAVYLPGFIPYQNIGDWYGLANAFVHPALQEQWGLVLNEACAAGLPVLCSRTVGARYELIDHGRNGLLFDPESVLDMTDALKTIHQMDADLRIKMGRNSQEIVENFSPQVFADGLLKAIQASLNG
ncbi:MULTISPECIES: glycosyltransferase family 4 protein [unclassified Tolypothrix]|uniref:glycosyltransferase family 4 protein n=1 Tax=unclassified Tolypothrix TaxID=2649714 RepID=UPI0005EAB395|nr:MULTISPECIES: glycosyltransferase family 4 protein [unclassified Tolypothrix]BAY94746.1 glycosyl transferase, group 1 family protein [Microchaete diplosiphon NIES-3275]EKE99019.1 glycosyltransferase, group 1 family [Tolypothrix sp. PCC 7601]MBE9081345.1 glycosyltransferase family 4 protein [Tolypothrix sp. LEGE 11397]UYD28434.1 glycosyltransferase family 4 protein [Tolypothrix sp. PCC 7712]UYD35686.1 glycosyltransferase family 4 protein [Tolypothrix sp. PCC 7601]